MKKRLLLTIDISLFISAIVLTIIGISFIFSSGVSSTGIVYSNQYIKQIIWAIIGLLLLVTITLIRYEYLKSFSPYIFTIFFILVFITLISGRIINGARSWIGVGQLGIQPSEFLKLGFILLLARYCENNVGSINSLKGLIKPFILLGSALILILLQPDLGTAMVFIPIFISMLFFAGVKIRYLLYPLLTGVIVVVLSMLPSWENQIHGARIPLLDILRVNNLIFGTLTFLGVILVTSIIGLLTIKRRFFYWIIYGSSIILLGYLGSFGLRSFLKDYQIMRLIVFLDPYVDRLGAGWNIIQSVIAVGSGGVFGKGFLQGPQSHLQYLPEQSTDFIFSILSEEWGFIGGALVMGLYTLIFFRGLRIARQARDSFGALTAVGIITMFFTHFVINIGMAMGIMPITGIPLLFVSYGGSSLWTALIGIAILLNIGLNRYRY